MKPSFSKNFCFAFCFLLMAATSCKREVSGDAKAKPDAVTTDGLSEEELKALIENERRLSDLSHGQSSTTIDVITDAAELSKIRKQYARSGTISLEQGLIAGKPEAIAALKDRLRSSDPDVQVSGLTELNPYWDTVKIHVDAEVRKLVYALLDQPKTRYAAIGALRTVDPENAAAKLEQLLKGNTLEEEERREAISAIGQTKARTSTIQVLGSLLQSARQKGDPDRMNRNLVNALLDQYETADPNLRKAIESHLLPIANDAKAEDRFEEQILRTFADNPIPSLLPFFQARLSNPEFKASCLKGIAKLQGKAAQGLVQKSLASKDEAKKAIEAIPFAWKGDPKGALAALNTAYKNLDDEYDQHGLLDIAWQTGGATLAQDFVKSIPDAKAKKAFEEGYHLLYEPIRDDHPMQVKAKQLAATGLLTKPITLQEMEAIRSGNREYGIWSWDEDFIDHVGTVVWFDAETGMFPNPYDDLILNSFVPATQGKLAGLECYMTWSDEDEENPEEEVWVIFKGKGYHFVPEYYGDWYDLDAVQSVMEKVLEDAGIPERFVSWDTGDQTAGYIFATPAKAREAIQTLNLGR